MSPRIRRRSPAGHLLAGVALVAALVLPVSVPDATAATSAPVPVPTLAWAACTDAPLKRLDCATLVVPRDYANPGSGTFDLAVVRVRSTGAAKDRIGSLVFNPGGPGIPAVDLAPAIASALPTTVRQRFDLVIWDPRGSARSANGLEDCADGYFAPPATGEVDWNAVLDQMRRAETAANSACQARHPDVVPYIGTNNTVRDLEALRTALGEKRITFWGTSYGTRIGYLYALSHPDRVRAMLLSSSVSPSTTWGEFAVGAGASPDTALGLLFEAHPKAAVRYRRAMHSLDRAALTLPSGTSFTRWHVRGTLAGAINDASFAAMARFLATVDRALHGKGRARTTAVRSLDRTDWPDAFPIRGGATPFIGCLDYPQRLAPDDQSRLAQQVRERAPVSGWLGSVALFYCDGVTVPPDPVRVDGADWSTPLLLVGSTRDALTPYAWTADMATSFRDSRVVTVVSGTHTPVFSGSACVDRYAIAYLVSLSRPRIDVACPSLL